jgi:DNA ligase (NAD+)
MEIQDIGETTLLKIVDDGLVRIPSDLYKLTVEQLQVLERLGESSAKNIVRNIQASRTQPTWRVLGGLMIKGLGNTTSKQVATVWPTLKDFMETCNFPALVKLDKIGETIATNIRAGQGRVSMQEIMRELVAEGVGMTVEVKAAVIEGPLKGKTFCLTGSPELNGEKVKKAILEKMITDAGGLIDKMTKTLTYLVAGPDSIAEGSNKLEKAKKNGTLILSGDEVVAMINQQ